MQEAQKQSNAEELIARIINTKATLMVYEKALRSGYMHGQRLTSEGYEIVRDEIAHLKYCINADTRKLTKGAA